MSATTDKEYFKWVERLAQAKTSLDDKYMEVDSKVRTNVYHKAASHEKTVLANRPNGDFGQVKVWYVTYIILRQIIAYHFYNRATFEEVPEKSLVKRVQVHLMKMNIPMLDRDIAQMLQAAADKIPLEQAVEKARRSYVQKIRKSAAVSTAFNNWGLLWDTFLLVGKLQETRVNGGPVDRSKIKQFFDEINEDRLKNATSTFNTDEKIELFMERCAEPLVRNESSDNHAATAIEYVLDSPDFKSLIDYAAAKEKENLSWEATIGPAVKALKRLGKSSAGKDFDKLAAYAKAHQKPQTV